MASSFPTTSAVTEAIAACPPQQRRHRHAELHTAPGYPISVVTYLLVRQDNPGPEDGPNLRTFAGLLLANNTKADVARLRAVPAEPH